MLNKDKEDLYKSLIDICLECSERLRDDERCLVIEAAKTKKDLEFYEKNKCGYEKNGKCMFGKNAIR